jgi:acyl carrier protein
MADAKASAGELREMVRAFILREFLPGASPEELADDTPLITGGILDSLATVKLVAALEDTYGVEVQPHEASAQYMDTVTEIVKLTAGKLGNG